MSETRVATAKRGTLMRCEECLKEVFVPARLAGKKRFCSDRCKNRWHSARRAEDVSARHQLAALHKLRNSEAKLAALMRECEAAGLVKQGSVVLEGTEAMQKYFDLFDKIYIASATSGSGSASTKESVK